MNKPHVWTEAMNDDGTPGKHKHQIAFKFTAMDSQVCRTCLVTRCENCDPRHDIRDGPCEPRRS